MDLVVPTLFVIKSSWHQGPKVRATNLHGTWKTSQRTSSMFFLMPLALTEQQIDTALLFLAHHCQIDFPAHVRFLPLWSSIVSAGVFARLCCT